VVLDKIIALPVAMISYAIIKIPLFSKYKIRLLSTWQATGGSGNRLYDYLFWVFHKEWVNSEYLKETDPDKRETLKSICLSGESGRNWAEYLQTQFNDNGEQGTIDFDKKIGHLTIKEANPIFDEISEILGNTDSNYLVIQIGSSSGKVVAYFAKKFPQHKFIGTDIYDEIVEYASQHQNLSNLSFLKCSAKETGNIFNLVDIDIKNKKILVFGFGSIQYVQPEHLTIFFNSISKFSNCEILLAEPGNESKGKPDQLKTSIHRDNLSYTHDYKWYAEESGIETVKSQIIRPYYPYKDFPGYENTIHYFYYGKTT
jgi:trans-aconitate methyltransferase